MSTKKLYGIESLEKRFGKMTVGAFIKAFRESEEVSQIDFAHKLGLSRANLCDIEKERKLVSIGRAYLLAKKLGIPPMVLVQLSIQDSLHKEGINFQVSLKLV